MFSGPPPDDGAGPKKAPNSDGLRSGVRPNQEAVIEGAVEAVLNIAGDFVPIIAAARRVLPVNDVELISAQIQKFIRRGSPLPRDLQNSISENVLGMHSQLSELVQATAEWVEYYEYWDVEKAAARLPAANLRSRAGRLIAGEKALHVSAQSLKTTVALFVRMNEQIVAQVDCATSDVEDGRNLLLANAVLAYEVADYVAH